MATVKIRVLSGIIGALIVLGAIFSTPVIFHILLALAGYIMLYELHGTFTLHKKWPLLVLNYFFATVFFAVSSLTAELFLMAVTLYLLLALSSCVFFHKTIQLNDAVHAFFSLLYAILMPVYLSGIRWLEHGALLVLLTLIGAWMPDTFAYFVGCLMGKHKLIPAISPKKTIEGSIGALAGALICFFAYGLILDFGFGFTVSYPALLILSLFCGVAAQIGDLSASVIKRTCNIKDFGNLIPGHGGIMDRVDSLIFIAPLVYYFLQFFEVICK